MQIFKAEGYKKGIISSVLFNAIAKITSIINLFVIANYFGTGNSSDIYFFLFSSTQLLVGLITAMDASVLIPEAMRLREQENEEKSMYFLNFFFVLYFIIGIAVISLISISPLKFFSLFSNFNQDLLIQNIPLLYASVALFLVMVLCNLLASILASYRYFTTPMIVSVINNLLALILLVIFHKKIGIISAIYGLLAGYVLNLFLLIHHMRKSLGWKFKVARYKLNTRIRRNLLFSQIGNFCSFLFNYVSLYLLSGLGTGMISAVNYGQRLSGLPTQFITTQFSSVAGIKMNEEFANGQMERLNDIFNRGVKFLLFILTPIAAYTFFYSKDIVVIIFKRGAFNSESVESTHFFLKYLVLIVPLIGIDTFFARIFMATQKIAISALNQIIISLLQLLLIFIFIKYMGGIGYAYAMVLGYGLSVILIYFFVLKYFPAIEYKKVLIYFFKILLINACIGLVTYYFTTLLQLKSWGLLISSGVIYFVLLYTINYIFNINVETNAFIKRLWKNTKKMSK